MYNIPCPELKGGSLAKSEPAKEELRENNCYCSTKEITLQEDIYTESMIIYNTWATGMKMLAMVT